MGTLDGKVAIVTGAAQGIGAVYARHLAGCGAAVVLADIDEAAASATADALTEDGSGAWSAGVDIADPDACTALVDSVIAREGQVDILVNNAAIYHDVRSTLAEDIPVDVWRRIVDVNVNGMFFMCRAVIPHMKSRGSGVIVNQTSGSIWVAPPGMAHYVTTKAAAIPLTKVLARELGPARRARQRDRARPHRHARDACGHLGRRHRDERRRHRHGPPGHTRRPVRDTRVPLLRRRGLRHRPDDRGQRGQSYDPLT